MPEREPKPKPPPAPKEDQDRPEEEPQVGILPGDIPTDDPKDPRFPGSQPDLA